MLCALSMPHRRYLTIQVTLLMQYTVHGDLKYLAKCSYSTISPIEGRLFCGHMMLSVLFSCAQRFALGARRIIASHPRIGRRNQSPGRFVGRHSGSFSYLISELPNAFTTSDASSNMKLAFPGDTQQQTIYAQFILAVNLSIDIWYFYTCISFCLYADMGCR